MSALRLAMLGALVVPAACGSAQSEVDRDLQRMRDQPKAMAYAASGAFPDGKVMQAPPPGTVAREQVLDQARATGRDTAGRYLDHVPLPDSPALRARGRLEFRVFCGACHGVGGFGGSLVAANMVERRPPSLRTCAAAALPPGQVYEVIRNGFGRMPSYASELSVDDRWAVVAHVLALRGRPAADSAERDDSVRAATFAPPERAGPQPGASP
ncbi:MAG TPA: c-type cytochrome [Gemmatimonadales bacterium]|nr:c-type cytochrome [Gemmatimonadales bacterium]